MGAGLVACVGGNVGLSDRVEDDGHRGGGVEVVVHHPAERGQHRRVGIGRHFAEPTRHPIEAGQRLHRCIDVVLTDRDRAAVVRLQQQHAVRPRVVLLHQVEQVVDVAEALRHLLALGIDDEAMVHPVVREPLAQSDRLGALVLVMGELEVLPTAVEVEALTEQIEAHHHALAVPPWAALSPGRRPRRLARLGELPQGEVGRVSFVAGPEHLAVATAGQHVVEALMHEQAIALHRGHRQVHTIVGDIPVAECHQLLDHCHHLRYVLGGVGHVGGPSHIDLLHGLEPHGLALVRDLLPRTVLTVGAIDDAVVDVGDVADQADLQPAPLEVPAQHVVDQGRAAVADVRRAVHGGTAQVDAHRAGLAHGELTYLPGGGVVQVQHGPQPTRSTCTGPEGFPNTAGARRAASVAS